MGDPPTSDPATDLIWWENKSDNHIKGTSSAYQEQIILDMLGERILIQPQEVYMKLYAATDLHSSNNYLAIIDENGERRFKQKLPNNADIILGALRTYKEEIVGIVVEFIYNWHLLVDFLIAEGYKVHLSNPVTVQKYSG